MISICFLLQVVLVIISGDRTRVYLYFMGLDFYGFRLGASPPVVVCDPFQGLEFFFFV